MKNGYRRILTFLIFSLCCLAVTAIGLMLLAFIMNRFGLTENMLSVAIIILYILSAFTGGLFSGRIMKKKKYLWGFLTGTMYFFILLIMSLCVNGEILAEEQKVITTYLLCAGGGMLGGMLS